ncbi:sigma-54-dependent transcriptional regulator [Pseudokordiimonas caeni]|uniref:sigma-54-dependent transcriptional regulator n=1 Tax=Pseudokordiimonas caeni TaxID=2997908 RepID=UPI002811E922|nr:sigma-54 dependent transcriptional regulator [Pseudokordiimonas caeni]
MAEKAGSILIVDDDEDILVAGRLLLKRHFDRVTTTNRPADIRELLAREKFDAILLDMNFGPGESSGEEGFAWLKVILELDPEAVVVMITAHGGVDTAVEAMKLGATDFIAKPWQNEKVVATLSAAVKLGQSRDETARLKGANKTLAAASVGSAPTIIGDAPPMQDLMRLIARAAPTDANVLILGENGTGKELVARELHRQSRRSSAVFMGVDLGSIAESLFESELFGHKKGAFTDAKEDRTGRFVAASGGTLFLDEIGNLPLHLQAKLLTVLERREVTPVGATRAVPIDVRVIAATNIALDQLHDEARFRQDLLFRLNTVTLTLPPLRDRREDIPALATHYAAFYARKYGKAEKPFSPDALAALATQDWPGNVRALRHAIERATILSDTERFEARDFSDGAPTAAPAPTNGDAAAPALDDLNLERLELAAISTALKKHRYNISHAAKDLGLTRAALYRRMEKHGL